MNRQSRFQAQAANRAFGDPRHQNLSLMIQANQGARFGAGANTDHPNRQDIQGADPQRRFPQNGSCLPDRMAIGLNVLRLERRVSIGCRRVWISVIDLKGSFASWFLSLMPQAADQSAPPFPKHPFMQGVRVCPAAA